MKLGFIGFGKMSQCLIQGLLNKGFHPEEIYVTSLHLDTHQDKIDQLNLTACQSAKEVVKQTDFLFLGYPPEALTTVAKEIAPFIRPEEQLVFSFLTGVSLQDLEHVFGPLSFVRFMPNLNVSVNEGAIAYCFSDTVDEQDQKEALFLLQTLGNVYPFLEKDFSTFVALAGSAPAFVYLFIDALARNAVKYGLTKTQATAIACQVVKGSGKMALTSKQIPWALVDDVSSPGGSTIEGVLALQEEGFFKAIGLAMEKTIKKDARKRTL